MSPYNASGWIQCISVSYAELQCLIKFYEWLKVEMSGHRFFKVPFSFPCFCNGTNVPLPISSNSCCSKHSLKTNCMVLCNSCWGVLTSSFYLALWLNCCSVLLLQIAFLLKRWGCSEVFCILWMGIVSECCSHRNDSRSVISLLHKCFVGLTEVYLFCHGHIGSLIPVCSVSWLFWTFYCYHVGFLQLYLQFYDYFYFPLDNMKNFVYLYFQFHQLYNIVTFADLLSQFLFLVR